MGGSPIICQDKIVGIFVGGPALNGQRIFFQAAIELQRDDIQNSFSTFLRFLSFEVLHEINLEIINSSYKELIKIKEDLINGNFQDAKLHNYDYYKSIKRARTWELISCIVNFVNTVIDKDCINHNTGLPTYESAFIKLVQDSENLYQKLSNVYETEGMISFFQYNQFN